jgi:signal transduction histidine kinase
MAMHSALFARAPAPDEALRAGRELADPRLEALRRFVRAIVRELRRPEPAEWQALERAGFSERQALDALLGVGVYLLSTLSNVLTESELDPPFEAFRWRKA